MSEQLSLFNLPDDAVAAAITKISGPGAARPNHVLFVQRLGSLMTALPDGSLILAAAPSGAATDEICTSLDIYFSDGRKRTGNARYGRIAEVDLPHSPSQRNHERRVIDAYYRFSVSSLSANGQLTLGDFHPQLEPLRQVCALAAGQPVEYFVLRNGHHLAPSGGDLNESVERLRFLVEVARQSRKTHVLFVSPLIARQWLESAIVAQEVTACWLRPYAMRDPESFREFKGVLKAYDRVIPRIGEFTLLERAAQIFEVVWGCPYRLKKWVRTTLAQAMARGASAVGWNDFVACAPNAKEQSHAREEFVTITEITATPDALIDTPESIQPIGEPKPRALKPGQRKLGRDDAGQAAEVA